MARPRGSVADPDMRESYERDPVAYAAIEQLHDAYEQLVEALDVLVRVTAFRLSPRPRAARPRQDLAGARERVECAKQGWKAAVTEADALLRNRQVS